jgi:thiol-disulfide isomerase/thioredoxin
MLSKLSLVFAFAWLLASASLFGGGPRVGEALPAMERFELEGKIPSLKGKVVVVDFWATWCPSCRQSFPAFERLVQHFGSDKLVVVAVSVDESAADLKRYLAAHPVSFSTVRDARHSFAAAVEPAGMPTTLVLDRKGIVRLVHVGFHADSSEASLQAAISKLLDASAH